MKFAVKKRDGPARVGELLLDDKKISTPNIAFINTSRFQAPDFAELLISNTNIQTDKPSLIIGNTIFSSDINCKNDNLSINNYLLYSNDLPLDLIKKSVKYDIDIEKKIAIIIPRKEIIDDFVNNDNLCIFIVSNSAQLFLQRSKFVDFITNLRGKIGYQKLIYIPSIGNPSNLALFTYMGIDLFDSTSAIIFARNNILFFPDGQFHKDELIELHCNCPSCIKFNKDPSEMNFLDILNHNYYVLENELKLVRNSIYNQNLRELVETKVTHSPMLSSILKILDKNHYEFFEERLPINRSKELKSTTKHSLNRAEIVRFQNRVQKRYIKPLSAEILLLLPCSAKKPYSYSKTHKKFKDRLSILKNPYIIHELIITSPLGIVPRELELIYPASKYDIDVSGYWDEDEKKMIRSLLKSYLETYNYKKIIVHLPLSIQDFILDILKNPIITCIDTPTSEKSLDKLSFILEDITSKYKQVEYFIRTYENIMSIAAYQFGKKIAEKLLENCVIKGKYPYQKILKKEIQIGMITKDRGMISLTLEGAKTLALNKKYWVEIFDDFNLIGSVFAPGVKNADEKIRIGDEVVILRNQEICGVGVALMNGKEMIQSDYGEAIKVRHRV